MSQTPPSPQTSPQVPDPAPDTPDTPLSPRSSPGRRFLTVGFLVVLMFVPLFFAAEVIKTRKDYSEQTVASVGAEWGGAQLLSGPQLVIPVEATVTRLVSRPRIDPDTGAVVLDEESGEEIVDRVRVTVQERVASAYLYPDTFDVTLETQSEVRRRGIFEVPVYRAALTARFDFDTARAAAQITGTERLMWEAAELRVAVTGSRGLRGAAVLRADGEGVALEPLTDRAGLRAAVGDPRGVAGFDLTLGLNGADRLQLTPVGRVTSVEMTSDWPHPSFDGAFLPDETAITDSGFRAVWTIPHLARALPQIGRADPEGMARQKAAFGVRFLQPNDFYQKAYRAARYGVLFIALTFLTILLIEKGAARPAHPVQYIFAGLAQTVFVLLMVAYAEHIGFARAYLAASVAVIGLLTLFGAVALKLGARTLVLGAMLVVVYAVLYLILQSADHALLAGATLAFLALALTMITTRNEDWHGPDRPRRAGPWSRAAAAMTQAAGAPVT